MLSAADLSTIRTTLRREPTDVELACFENLWSEHCSYRSTKRLLKTLPTSGADVILGPGDDAAIVRFSERTALAIAMESHNHPSYIDPYDGAATGVGGIVRDVLSMGARPVALMDPLYFGPLDREKNRYLLENVVEGIGGYGNCIGVPVVRGDLAFDSSYNGNPLVNVVCVGIVHPERYITARAKQPGNHLVLIGASTGRDGLGGASFASRDLSEDSDAEDRPSVGDPFTEKLLIEAILEMAETGKIFSCRDLGAAGLAGASSEMCSTFGGLIHADRVHQREPNMRPVEIMLAESQERMLIEVAPSDVSLMGSIAEKYDLKWADVGQVIAEPRYIVKFHGKTVADIPILFLSSDAPECNWESQPYNEVKPFTPPHGTLDDLLLKVLSHPEVAHRTWVVEQYDHDVQVRTISLFHDAALVRLEGESLGLAFSCGCNPRQIFLSPYSGTANAVYENAANLACIGSDPLCIVNCLNFASPVHTDIYWQLSECVKGMGDMARSIGVPVVGGNVSLYNESDEMATRIKPTPSIGMVGRVPVTRAMKPEPGMGLAVCGQEGTHFGGSVLDAILSCGGTPPPKAEHSVLKAIRTLSASDRNIAVTDISQGGLVAALATFLPGARVRLEGPALPTLLSETYGRFLIAYKNESSLEDLDCRIIGEVTSEGLEIQHPGGVCILSKDQIEFALSSFTRVMMG